VTEAELGLAAPLSGPRVLAPLGRRLCAVTGTRPAGEYRVIAVDDPDGPEPLPGQFYMLAAKTGWGEDRSGERPYLARAFSFCRTQEARREFMVDAIGPGTARLAGIEPGEQIWLVGPLGVGFSPSDRALLVGGGIGIAPLVGWSEVLIASGARVATLLGFRSASYAKAAESIAGDVEIATDDGSEGHQGLVTDLLLARLDDDDRQVVYACGPPAMLEAVRRICVERDVEAQLAMEEAMACGYGACFGCVVRTEDGYRRLCVDGPVVRASELHEQWL